MRRIALVALLAVVAAGAPRAQPADSEIKLVLLIAVDQFRADYLTRFRSEFNYGFEDLLTRGAVFTEARLDHYPTVTAVGHSTMLSGATPAVSGIIGNDWYDRRTARQVTSVSDASVNVIGRPDVEVPAETDDSNDRDDELGLLTASPHRLLAPTLGDELKRAAAAETPSRVLSASLKDRSAILMGGRDADMAFWYDDTSGAMISSTYYGDAVPGWVDEFNGRTLADEYANRLWVPVGGNVARRLPPEPGLPLYGAVYSTPFGNELLLAFVEDLITHESLGSGDATDLLAVSFSANDPIGHGYGPDSPEVHDVTIRTDALIGRLLTRIDQQVGLDRTLVVLTSDHGVSRLPEVSGEGGRMTTLELIQPIQDALAQRFGNERWILSTAGSAPYLDHDLIARRRLDPREVRKVAARAAAGAPHVARVYTRDELEGAPEPDGAGDDIDRIVRRSFNVDRSGDLEILLEPHWLRQETGTTHGTPYEFDSRIPLIFMGPGVVPGSYDTRAILNDLSPTLAHLLGVATPAGASGRVLQEALASPPTSP